MYTAIFRNIAFVSVFWPAVYALQGGENSIDNIFVWMGKMFLKTLASQCHPMYDQCVQKFLLSCKLKRPE